MHARDMFVVMTNDTQLEKNSFIRDHNLFQLLLRLVAAMLQLSASSFSVDVDGSNSGKRLSSGKRRCFFPSFFWLLRELTEISK